MHGICGITGKRVCGLDDGGCGGYARPLQKTAAGEFDLRRFSGRVGHREPFGWLASFQIVDSPEPVGRKQQLAGKRHDTHTLHPGAHPPYGRVNRGGHRAGL